MVSASFFFRLNIKGTSSTVRADRAALKWMAHMDGTHGRLARWRLRLPEFNFVVQTRPVASHHAADTMSRISTPAGDDGPISDAVPFWEILNSSAAWQLPPQTEGGTLFPLALANFLEGQAKDFR